MATPHESKITVGPLAVGIPVLAPRNHRPIVHIPPIRTSETDRQNPPQQSPLARRSLSRSLSRTKVQHRLLRVVRRNQRRLPAPCRNGSNVKAASVAFVFADTFRVGRMSSVSQNTWTIVDWHVPGSFDFGEPSMKYRLRGFGSDRISESDRQSVSRSTIPCCHTHAANMPVPSSSCEASRSLRRLRNVAEGPKKESCSRLREYRTHEKQYLHASEGRTSHNRSTHETAH